MCTCTNAHTIVLYYTHKQALTGVGVDFEPWCAVSGNSKHHLNYSYSITLHTRLPFSEISPRYNTDLI